ncbi:MAG: hypothetical protein ABWZ75_01970 [Novosphingobium sp.]
MFGPKLNTVFANRWKALWWAAMMLVTAYCSVPSADETAVRVHPGSGPVDHLAKHPANPWAKDSK